MSIVFEVDKPAKEISGIYEEKLSQLCVKGIKRAHSCFHTAKRKGHRKPSVWGHVIVELNDGAMINITEELAGSYGRPWHDNLGTIMVSQKMTPIQEANAMLNATLKKLGHGEVEVKLVEVLR